MDNRLVQFVRRLYFEMQTVENVKPLEIWNGVREKSDPYEMALLTKNLLKIAIPFVNEKCSGRPFPEHAQLVRKTLDALLAWYGQDPEMRLFQRFPHPPTGDGDQKALYREVRDTAQRVLAEIDSAEAVRPGKEARPGGEALPGAAAPGGEAQVDAARAPARDPAARRPGPGVSPDSLFDFRELRVVDNELPYIIFTEKEFRVIHGIAMVYLWIIDTDRILLETLARNGVPASFIDAYTEFARRVHRENPLTVNGKTVDSHGLAALIKEKMKYEDYLDVFENVHRWFEQTRRSFSS